MIDATPPKTFREHESDFLTQIAARDRELARRDSKTRTRRMVAKTERQRRTEHRPGVRATSRTGA